MIYDYIRLNIDRLLFITYTSYIYVTIYGSMYLVKSLDSDIYTSCPNRL